jgi:hypothetical protein
MGDGFKLRLVDGEELSGATTSARVGKVPGQSGKYRRRCLGTVTRSRQTHWKDSRHRGRRAFKPLAWRTETRDNFTGENWMRL